MALSKVVPDVVMMRILHAILSEGFYGSERYCIELAAEQARGGNDVEVLIVGEHTDCAKEMRKMETLANSAGAPELRLSVIPGWMPSMGHRLFARRAITRFRPDVVHTHLTPAARRVGEVGQKFGIPHFSTLHIHYNRREHDPCDGLLATANWQRDSVPEHFRHKVKVVRGWLPREVEDRLAHVDADEIALLRHAWNAGEADLVLGSVGRLMPEKGLDVLLRAFRTAFPRCDEPVRLVLVGDGVERDALRNLAAGDPRIVITGAQSNMARYYRAFDVFVSAARFEPFGIAILEAMAAGLPLVVTRTEGPREFVTDQRVLWAVPGDQTSLSRALREAARSRQRFDYDLENFSVARAAGEIEQFYREIVARRGPHIAF